MGNNVIDLSKFDLRFIEIYHELYALEQYMDSIESQLPDLVKKEEERAYENYHKKSYKNDPIEWQRINQELDELIEDVLPRFLRSPILVVLWAIFESAIIEIAKDVRDQKKLQISLNDINGDFLQKTNLYFNHILKISVDTRSNSWQFLRMIYILRNAIAHGNGRLDNIHNEKNIKKIREWEKKNIGIGTQGGNLVLSEIFLRKAYDVVFNELKKLIERVKSEYPATT